MTDPAVTTHAANDDPYPQPDATEAEGSANAARGQYSGEASETTTQGECDPPARSGQGRAGGVGQPSAPAQSRGYDSPEEAAPARRTTLSQLHRRVLAFEARPWKSEGAKAKAIAEEFDWSVNQYYFQLSALLDQPEAAAEQPALIRRLRAVRDERRDVRTRR
ncbi:DUF3263 domain-containing protein [Natronoglycomyces albus]|uniref:DUF3263 domain-containing protein n=1 Tax=Natronoglycomyces albus TaxID=2811108 RepID=A0A895XQE5_9ACTN|nr:DUF3263 domain-containing protein [Natronoglycomyces albus]QSB04776.1 DUF3263 domain-containing protein [Natronoglycomyces albus]